MLRPPEIGKEFWEIIKPAVEALAPGSAVVILVEPLKTDNVPRITWSSFLYDERKTIKTALIKVRAKRQKESKP